jgi:hypothetical protein
MRERTTWNRDQITAATNRTADPYAMNQDHLGQQPKADKYLTGDPSNFAEDVTSPNTWDREYAGGTTERNEIGEPEFRAETFNHGEKSASVAMDEKTLLKKADLCSRIARMMLKGRKYANAQAATTAVEQQAVSLMYLPNKDLIATASRLAAQEDFPGGEFPHQQEQQAAQEQAQQDQGQQQMESAVHECMTALQTGDQQKALTALNHAVMTAAKIHQAKKAAEEQTQQQSQSQEQQAAQDQQQGDKQQQDQGMQQQALEQMLAQATEQAVQAADYDAKKGPAVNPPGYGPENGPQAGGAKTAKGKRADQQQAPDQQQMPQQQQQQQAVQQTQQDQQTQDQVQQQQAVQQQEPQMPQQQDQGMQADDQLLDDMLMGPQAGAGPSEVDIELEASPMDTGEVVLSATDDEVLKTLFANEETEQAQQAQGMEPGQKQARVRTASANPSTRTLGTRPTAGVSKVGGAPSGRSGSDVDSLASLWPSAPDVKEAFNLR